MDPGDVDQAVVDTAVRVKDGAAIDVLSVADYHHGRADAAVGIANLAVVDLQVVAVLLKAERNSFVEAHQPLSTTAETRRLC